MTPRLDAAIAVLAAKQYGVVELSQLRSLGLSDRTVRHRVVAGRLHRLHRGVFAVGHPRLTVDGRRMAAVLACGPDAALASRAAGDAWGVHHGRRTEIDVIRPGRGGRQLPGIHVHNVRDLDPEDVTELRGVRITTVARTLLDLATVLDQHRLERAIHEAEVLELLDMNTVQATVARNNGHPGIGSLRTAFSLPDPGVTRQGIEDLFLRVCREGVLDVPAFNALVTTPNRVYEVDALWPAAKLIVELDGGAVHRTRRAFEEDRRRDAALAAEGYLVIRVTWRRLTRERRALVVQLRRILDLRLPAVRELGRT